MPATPYHDTAVIDKPWDGPGAEAALPDSAKAATLSKLYAWVDPSKNADTKSAYKLPHHEISGGEPGAANVNGVRAALAALGGARGGTSIPAADEAAVRSHLQRHLDKFDASKKKSEADDFLGLVTVGGVIETLGRAWAVTAECAAVLAEMHGRFVGPEVERVLTARPNNRTGPNGQVATIPLMGLITPRASFMSLLMGGGGGLQSFRRDLQSAVEDPSVSHIVLNVDSPGGIVDGVPETADAILKAREQKPIVAVANTLAASAAYWLASQAHEVVVSPSGQVGSIGVYQLHRDVSGMMAKAGINPTLISAGKYKTEGHPYQPLESSARDAAQQMVDDYYQMFVKGVAGGRGVDPQEVAAGYGEGRVQMAKRAVASGLADKVATLEQTQARLASGRAKVRGTEAEDQSSPSEAEKDGSMSVELLGSEERNLVFDALAGTR